MIGLIKHRTKTVQEHEVDWYRQNGSYPSTRIVKTKDDGREYVIGDNAWNKAGLGRNYEEIEPQMGFDNRNLPGSRWSIK